MIKKDWITAAHHLSQQGSAYVMVTLMGASGSTPRNSGTKMVVTEDAIFDTIGGGHLEHKVIQQAHQFLLQGEACQHLQQFKLGDSLGQCCGGTVSVLFECFAATGVNIMVFGAGHVGQALIPVIAELPCNIIWVDSRPKQFPAVAENYSNVSCILSEDPQLEVTSMAANSYYIVMTHNHQIDFDITRKILLRGDFDYLGLIASDTKWRRFKLRYQHREIDPSQVARMNCPIGMSTVPGKRPAEIAVSIAAEIIQRYQQQNKVNGAEQTPPSHQGIRWKQLKQLINEQP